MTRNLKALGLALVVALALGAIGAQGASAHNFTSSVEPTVLTGEAESPQVFTATSGLEVSCSVATFEGTVKTKSEDIVTVHPKYSSCTSSLGAATVHTNGCNYKFGSDTTQATGHSASSLHAPVSLECESTHIIEITAPGCNISFAEKHSTTAVNQSLHGVTYTNLNSHSGKKAVTVNATVRTIKYNATAGSLCGLAGHPAATYSNGTYSGQATVTGYAESGFSSGSTTNGTVWSHGGQVDIEVD